MNETFNFVSKEWLLYYEGKVKHTSYKMYTQKCNNLCKEFGHMEMTKITQLQLQQFLNELHRQRYSKSTIKKHKITLNLIYKYYRSKHPDISNPCVELYLPKGALVKKRKPVDIEQVKVVFQNINHNDYLYPLFLLGFGLRRSEAVALLWEDLDIENGLLIVNKSIEFIHNLPFVSETLKNGDKQRVIPILPLLFDRLAKLKEIHKTGVIFSVDGENYMTESQITKLWKKFRNETGLSATQHQFRHTYATLLYQSGVDLKTAMELMGHHDLKMLVEIYAHADEKTLKKAIDITNHFIKNEMIQ